MKKFNIFEQYRFDHFDECYDHFTEISVPDYYDRAYSMRNNYSPVAITSNCFKILDRIKQLQKINSEGTCWIDLMQVQGDGFAVEIPFVITHSTVSVQNFSVASSIRTNMLKAYTRYQSILCLKLFNMNTTNNFFDVFGANRFLCGLFVINLELWGVI